MPGPIATLPQTQEISFSEFLERVARENLAYAAQRYNVSLAQAAVEAAREFQNPTLQLGAGRDVTHGGRDRMPDLFNASLTQTIELGGKRKYRILSARQNLAATAFKSVRSSLLILLNVPFALIGGILALFITGIPLSVSAAIGFIALFGQAVLNGVVMVSFFNQLRERGANALQAVQQGAPLRLRTVLMTGLLAMLGLLPMALSHGIGSETQKPLAIVIIGGLVSATLLTLVVLPTLYLLFAPDENTTS